MLEKINNKPFFVQNNKGIPSRNHLSMTISALDLVDTRSVRNFLTLFLECCSKIETNQFELETDFVVTKNSSNKQTLQIEMDPPEAPVRDLLSPIPIDDLRTYIAKQSELVPSSFETTGWDVEFNVCFLTLFPNSTTSFLKKPQKIILKSTTK